MRIDRLAVAGCALVASTILISCGSDDDSTPANNSVGTVGTIGVDTTLDSSNTLATDTSLGGGTETSSALGSAGSSGTTTP